jgi:hypothetical protein
VAEAQRLSKTYRQGAKRASTLAAVLCCLFGLALSAKAQEPTYSADSLTATFEKGSQISVKGTEIFLRDVVAEIRNSRVIFKNSQSDRVICDLSPSTQHGTPLAVGSELRVKGRVRGRGLLGNVTLDDCNVASIDESAVTPYIEPQEVASIEPDEILDTEETLPAAPPVSDRPRSIPKQLATPPGAPRAAFVPGPVEQAPRVTDASDYSDSSIKPSSDSQGQIPYGFYAFLVLSGAVSSLILSKLLTPALRVSRPRLRDNTPELRQAALQSLLLKAEKKK